IVGAMKEKLLDLTLPQRANQPSVKTEAKKKSSGTVVGTTSRPPLQRSISEKPCVVLLNKPVEDILVRYEKMPMDFSTLHVREPENTLSVSQSRRNKAVATLFNTLSKYMYHQRWIWSAHTGTSVQISMQAISKVLSTLTKVRLAEGFNFAHCNSGIISFVTELQMKVSLFTLTDVSTDQEVNSENCESANCILFLLLHEKQRCLNQREIILTDTECYEFPKLVLQRQRNGENPPFSINEENTPVLQQQTMEPALSGSQVLSLLPSQERVADLSDSQQTTSSAQDTSQSDQLRPHLTTSSSPPRWSCYIRHVGSSRLLITIMPASYKDLKKIMKSSAAMETMSEDAAKENNKDEKKVLQMESTKVEEMKCDKNPADSKRHQSGSSDSYPRPVYRRGRSVDASRRASQPNNGGYGNSNALTLPVYVYECIYSSLTSQLVNKAKESNKLEDVFQDQRFQNMEFNSWENDELSEGNKIKERTTSGGSGKFFKDQRPASIIGQNLELNWHCNTLVDAYQQCFATGLYKSLCTEQYVDSVDVQLVVDQLCEESWLEIDVTDFLQAVCGHINNFSKKVNQEEHAMESFQRTARLKNQRDHDTEDKSPVSSIEELAKTSMQISRTNLVLLRNQCVDFD
uniref:Protein SZT2-like n=1 Tax=Saccoglossus kowalevskii TaxID=10224 RepID=A0ABM0LXU6_SACKO